MGREGQVCRKLFKKECFSVCSYCEALRGNDISSFPWKVV